VPLLGAGGGARLRDTLAGSRSHTRAASRAAACSCARSSLRLERLRRRRAPALGDEDVDAIAAAGPAGCPGGCAAPAALLVAQAAPAEAALGAVAACLSRVRAGGTAADPTCLIDPPPEGAPEEDGAPPAAAAPKPAAAPAPGPAMPPPKVAGPPPLASLRQQQKQRPLPLPPHLRRPPPPRPPCRVVRRRGRSAARGHGRLPLPAR